MKGALGMFHVLPLIEALCLEAVFLVCSVEARGYLFSFSYAKWIVIVNALLLLFCFCGAYSIGDYGIICVCQLMYLIIYPEFYVIGVFVMVFAGMFFFLVRNVFRIKEVMQRKDKRFPFTMYIAIGAYVGMFFMYFLNNQMVP